MRPEMKGVCCFAQAREADSAAECLRLATMEQVRMDLDRQMEEKVHMGEQQQVRLSLLRRLSRSHLFPWTDAG